MLQLSKPHGVDNAIVIVFTKTVPIQDPLKTESDAATRTDHLAAPEEDDDIDGKIAASTIVPNKSNIKTNPDSELLNIKLLSMACDTCQHRMC